MVLISISLISDVEHFFLYLLVTYVIFGEMFIEAYCQFLNCIICFFWYCVFGVPYVF